MTPQEYSNSNSGQSVILGGNFSAEEVDRLTRLRSGVAQLPDWFDCSEDGVRLEFARWLYDHGKLTDE